MRATEVTTSLNSPWQYLKASNVCAVKFTHVKGLALRPRTASVQKLHTGYLENLTAYGQQIIKLQQKYNYLLRQMCTTYGTPVISDMLTNTTIDTKGAKPVLVSKMGQEKLGFSSA
jgi:hypothetical protein